MGTAERYGRSRRRDQRAVTRSSRLFRGWGLRGSGRRRPSQLRHRKDPRDLLCAALARRVRGDGRLSAHRQSRLQPGSRAGLGVLHAAAR